MSPPVAGMLLGHDYCDRCPPERQLIKQRCWLWIGEGGRLERVCGTCWEEVAGTEPPPVRTAADLSHEEPPKPAWAWVRITGAPGWRGARSSDDHVRVEHVRNLEGFAEPVTDVALDMTPAAFLEFVLAMSAYGAASPPDQAMVRNELIRIFYGQSKETIDG